MSGKKTVGRVGRWAEAEIPMDTQRFSNNMNLVFTTKNFLWVLTFRAAMMLFFPELGLGKNLKISIKGRGSRTFCKKRGLLCVYSSGSRELKKT